MRVMLFSQLGQNTSHQFRIIPHATCVKTVRVRPDGFDQPLPLGHGEKTEAASDAQPCHRGGCPAAAFVDTHGRNAAFKGELDHGRFRFVKRGDGDLVRFG